jgi:aryl-alcohol dehydrogenase-like predicted oxidoreductase
MRILIDECIDERFRNSLPEHDCQTARYAGLAGLKNGDLLTAAETAKFDVLLTMDQGIEYQQNSRQRSNRSCESVRACVDQIALAWLLEQKSWIVPIPVRRSCIGLKRTSGPSPSSLYRKTFES